MNLNKSSKYPTYDVPICLFFPEFPFLVFPLWNYHIYPVIRPRCVYVCIRILVRKYPIYRNSFQRTPTPQISPTLQGRYSPQKWWFPPTTIQYQCLSYPLYSMNEQNPCSPPLFSTPTRRPVTLDHHGYSASTCTLHTEHHDPRFILHKSCIRSYFTLYVTAWFYDQGHSIHFSTPYVLSLHISVHPPPIHRHPYSPTQRRTVFQYSSHTSLNVSSPRATFDIVDRSVRVLSYWANIYANSLWINIFNYFFCFDYCFLAILFL